MWDLLGLPEVQMASLKLMVDCSLIEICTDPHDAMVPECFGKFVGPQSHELITNIKKAKKPIEKYLELIKFFNTQDGDQEFCNMLSIMGGLGPQVSESTNPRIFHIQDSQQAYTSKA